MDGGRAEADEAWVLVVAGLRNRREYFGVEDRADLAADVVEHAIGVDSSIALAEDDVAFHVDFERFARGLSGAVEAATGIGAPDDNAIGLDVDVAERSEGLREAFAAEALDDDVDAARDDDHVLAGWRRNAFELRTETFGAREDQHFAEAGARRGHGSRRGNGLREDWSRQELRGLERRLL